MSFANRIVWHYNRIACNACLLYVTRDRVPKRSQRSNRSLPPRKHFKRYYSEMQLLEWLHYSRYNSVVVSARSWFRQSYGFHEFQINSIDSPHWALRAECPVDRRHVLFAHACLTVCLQWLFLLFRFSQSSNYRKIILRKGILFVSANLWYVDSQQNLLFFLYQLKPCSENANLLDEIFL